MKLASTVTLTINSKILKEEKCVKYLGLYIDSNLKWGNQVNYIKKKVKIEALVSYLKYVIM